MKVYVVSRYNWDWRDILPPVVFDDKKKAKKYYNDLPFNAFVYCRLDEVEIGEEEYNEIYSNT